MPWYRYSINMMHWRHDKPLPPPRPPGDLIYRDLPNPRSALCMHLLGRPSWRGGCREHHPSLSGIWLLQVGQDFVLQDFVPDPHSLAKASFF